MNGEGLQHQDGHSHVLSSTIPNCLSYDPAYAYELAIIFKDGIQKMFVEQQNYYYYITVTNENYEQPKQPKGVEQDVIKGLYKVSSCSKPQVRLLGSGAILNESIAAQEVLKKYSINAEVWSATSFNLLRKDGMEAERYNQLNPHKEKHSTHIDKCFGSHDIPVIATTDYMRAYAEQIRPYIYSSYSVLGTDGFGRSDSREELREFFEINTNHIVRLTAFTLYKESTISKKQLDEIYKDLKVDPTKPNPWEV